MSRSQSSTTPLPPYAPDCRSSPAPVSPSRGVKRARSVSSETELEEARPSKQPKSDTGTVLSEENLRKFEEVPAVKRTLSRRSTTKSDITSDSKSSISPSPYRFQYLAAAKLRINSDPPDHVNAAIDAITGPEPTRGRRDELKGISREFHTSSSDLASASDGEDDSVHVFLQALRAIKTKPLRYQEKADWREELKPLPPQPLFNADFLKDPDEPRKRQQLSTDQPQPSDASQADPPHVSNAITPPADPPHAPKTMPPPACTSAIKTPRPDVSIGIDMTELTSRLA
jgi:hypothetical protein